MSNFRKQLALVWTVVCISGLSIFLFQFYHPALPGYGGTSGVGITIVFWFLAWAVPMAAILFAGRRKE